MLVESLIVYAQYTAVEGTIDLATIYRQSFTIWYTRQSSTRLRTYSTVFAHELLYNCSPSECVRHQANDQCQSNSLTVSGSTFSLSLLLS